MEEQLLNPHYKETCTEILEMKNRQACLLSHVVEQGWGSVRRLTLERFMRKGCIRYSDNRIQVRLERFIASLPPIWLMLSGLGSQDRVNILKPGMDPMPDGALLRLRRKKILPCCYPSQKNLHIKSSILVRSMPYHQVSAHPLKGVFP